LSLLPPCCLLSSPVGTVAPRDQQVAAAQLYYGYSDSAWIQGGRNESAGMEPQPIRSGMSLDGPAHHGLRNPFFDANYGTGVTGIYSSGDHHLRSPPKHGSGPLDPSRISVLRSADGSMGQRSHLSTIEQGEHLQKASVKDDRYMNLFSDLYGKPVDSDMHRHMTPSEMRYAQAQKTRTGMSLVNHVAVSPRSFI
jgi:hypothetical protein